MSNVNKNEVKKFDAMAKKWWDMNGECKPLHQINPLRMQFITDRTDLNGKKVLDIGCGGGILTEALAFKGADATGIDMSKQVIKVAKLHALDSGLDINYQITSAEEFAKEHPQQFDVVTCMELLEHVPEPQSLIDACAQLLKPGGDLFLSTINRTPKAYVVTILGAEYFLRLLPKGTHDYKQFIRPSELAECLRKADLSYADSGGFRYKPLTKQYELCDDLSVNYLIHSKHES